MKRSKHAVLTAAVFAAALGASRYGSLPADAVTQHYLAATDQRTMQLLYGPGSIISPNMVGDINDDKVLDARDLTLLKRELLSGPYPALLGSTQHFNVCGDSFINGTDARVLMQRLTGEENNPKHPTELIVYLMPCSFFATEEPDSKKDYAELESLAGFRLADFACAEFYVGSDGKKISAAGEEWDGAPVQWLSLGNLITVRIPDGFVPNTTVTEDGVTRRQHVSVLNMELAFDHYRYEYPSPVIDDDITPADFEPVRHYEGTDRCTLSCPVVTFESVPGQEDVYYDKCLVEWNVNTDELRVHQSKTMEQSIDEDFREFEEEFEAETEEPDASE